MRIGIDFHAAEKEGSGNCTYIRNLVESLLQIDSRSEYFLYVTKREHDYYKKFNDIANVQIVQIPFKQSIARLFYLGVRSFFDRIDILHVQYIAPPFNYGKLIVTIHDVSYLHFPQCFCWLEVLRQRMLIPLNLMRSSKILTVSNFSKEDIVKNYQVNESKVVVTYCGTNLCPSRISDFDSCNSVLSRLNITKKYVLFVGRIDARKNVEGLIRSFNALKKTKKIEHQLVLVGNDEYRSRFAKEEYVNSKFNKDIIFTGYAPDSTLLCLYNKADVFVYPSFYEGFGLPCLESMACGCPVIASNSSAMPEITKDAAIVVDPRDEDAIADAIYKVVTDPTLRQSLIDKGLMRAKFFTWTETARITSCVYTELM